jgi:hypothetical protein
VALLVPAAVTQRVVPGDESLDRPNILKFLHLRLEGIQALFN